jgi:hypothetical protein
MSSSGRKSDYFGKFLETLTDPGATGPSARDRAPASPVSPLVDRTIAALRDGPKSVSALVAPPDEGISDVLSALQILQSLGYVTGREGDTFELTVAGKAVAEKLAPVNG